MDYMESDNRPRLTVRDFTIISAAMIEAASVTDDVSSYREVIRSVSKATDYLATDVSRVTIAMIQHGVLVHAVEIKRRGSALTALGWTIHQRMHCFADIDDQEE